MVTESGVASAPSPGVPEGTGNHPTLPDQRTDSLQELQRSVALQTPWFATSGFQGLREQLLVVLRLVFYTWFVVSCSGSCRKLR